MKRCFFCDCFQKNYAGIKIAILSEQFFKLVEGWNPSCVKDRVREKTISQFEFIYLKFGKKLGESEQK